MAPTTSWPGLRKREPARKAEGANSGCITVAEAATSLGVAEAGVDNTGVASGELNSGHGASQLQQFVAA
jgi:hypothetical protein